MRGRFKVLKVPSFFGGSKEEFDFLTDGMGLKETDYIFNRNGWYFDRQNKNSWVETDFGAWSYSSDEFIAKLKILNHRRLSPNVRKAIETLMLNKMCPKYLRDLHYWDEHILDLSRTYRSTRVMLNRI